MLKNLASGCGALGWSIMYTRSAEMIEMVVFMEIKGGFASEGVVAC